MNLTGLIAAILAVTAALAWSRFQSHLTNTTLTTARRFGWAAGCLWALAFILPRLCDIPPGLVDQLWYLAAIVGLCPLVAVLGARRPVNVAWSWFVLLPLVLVLEWPAAGQLVHIHRGLELESPAVLAYLAVLVPGAGNYVGTRRTLAALFYATALAMLVVSFSVSDGGAFAHDDARSVATATASVGVILAARRTVPDATGQSIERAWFEFRDTFGIVWAKRVLDRFNLFAGREHWPVVLTMQGLVCLRSHETIAQLTAGDRERVEQRFCWILKRFVDPPWLNERLGTTALDAAQDPA